MCFELGSFGLKKYKVLVKVFFKYTLFAWHLIISGFQDPWYNRSLLDKDFSDHEKYSLHGSYLLLLHINKSAYYIYLNASTLFMDMKIQVITIGSYKHINHCFQNPVACVLEDGVVMRFFPYLFSVFLKNLLSNLLKFFFKYHKSNNDFCSKSSDLSNPHTYYGVFMT